MRLVVQRVVQRVATAARLQREAAFPTCDVEQGLSEARKELEELAAAKTASLSVEGGAVAGGAAAERPVVVVPQPLSPRYAAAGAGLR